MLSPCMKFDTNWGPLSLITSSGSPCSFQPRPEITGDSKQGDIGCGSKEVGLLGQAIHSDKYGVVAMTLGGFRDQVNQDNLPLTVWDMVGHELSHWGCQKRLCSVTEVTAFHVLSNIPYQATSSCVLPVQSSSTVPNVQSPGCHGGPLQCHAIVEHPMEHRPFL